MEHPDHRDLASLVKHALRIFYMLVHSLYLAHITSLPMHEHPSLVDGYVKFQLKPQVN